MIAIVFAAAALGAWINELLEIAERESAYPPLPEVFKRLSGVSGELEGRNVSTGLKLQVICSLLGDAPLERGQQPFQDFDLLVGIRNVLMHLRSDEFPYGPGAPTDRAHNKLAKRLVERGVVTLPDGNTILPLMSALAGPRVAAWALVAGAKLALRGEPLAESPEFR